MLRNALVAAGILLVLAGCAPENERERQVRAPQIRVTGEAQQCLPLAQLQQTVVHDDYTIDFLLPGGQIYRNTLPARCYSLGFQRSFTYDVTTAQLCEEDTIAVLLSDGQRGTSCRLGRFLPVELVALDASE